MSDGCIQCLAPIVYHGYAVAEFLQHAGCNLLVDRIVFGQQDIQPAVLAQRVTRDQRGRGFGRHRSAHHAQNRFQQLRLPDRTPRLSGSSSPSLLPLMRNGVSWSTPRPLLAYLLEHGGALAGELALLFHKFIAAASVEGARRMAEVTGIRRIALSGGVFQNLLLRELLIPLLIHSGFEVFLNERVPPGDGGLSVGQVWYKYG